MENSTTQEEKGEKPKNSPEDIVEEFEEPFIPPKSPPLLPYNNVNASNVPDGYIEPPSRQSKILTDPLSQGRNTAGDLLKFLSFFKNEIVVFLNFLKKFFLENLLFIHYFFEFYFFTILYSLNLILSYNKYSN